MWILPVHRIPPYPRSSGQSAPVTLMRIQFERSTGFPKRDASAKPISPPMSVTRSSTIARKCCAPSSLPHDTHTGMRCGEILSLAWRTVDLNRAEIHVEAANEKTGRRRVIPLTDDLLATLKILKTSRPRTALDGSDPVFTNKEGTAITPSCLRRMYEPTVTRCEGLHWPSVRRCASTTCATPPRPSWSGAACRSSTWPRSSGTPQFR